MSLGTIDFNFDLSLGDAPLLYLLIFTVIAGLFVVEPIFYSSVALLSLVSIIISICIKPESFFDGQYLIENVINLISFIVVLSLVSYRNYRVTIFEYKANQRLKDLSYKDELTGLLNERSYINEIEAIDSKIKSGEEIKFAVVLMDVNNLKATNDAYGHRYGCSLVVRCGKTLPEIFKNSKLFHVGGDEFLAIVYGNDYDNFDELMKEFDEKMIYSIVEYEGQKLIFSVARGFAKYTNEEKFRDVLQIADDAMYINKKAIKEKYNMKSR
ncbi:MAG: GGDEF domain-containing protein [Bacilli bacterium]|nr:GGDEF domain-containing protein [Bacilli bacterium]